MTDKTKNSYIGNLFNSIEDYVSKGKEEELREKISMTIKSKIFSEDIEECLNSRDFSDVGLLDNSVEDISFMFSTIFPIFIESRGATFRLYKHKVEIMLSDKMKDRFIYIFSEGRLTSGEFKCYKLYEDEYVYIVKRVIENIPEFREAIKKQIEGLDEGMGEFANKKTTSKKQLDKSKENYNALLEMLK